MGVARSPGPSRAAPGRWGRSRRWRIAFVAVLLLAMAVGTITQFALGVLGPFMVRDLGISRAQLGLLTTAFFVVGAVGSPVAGPLVDRLGGRRMLAALFLTAGGGLAAMALAPTYAWLVVAVGLAGVGTAIINPVTNQLIAVHLPRGRQGAVTGVKQSGVQVAAFVAGVALPATALALGWRGAVAALAAVGAVALLVGLAVVPAAPAGDQAPAAAPREPGAPGIGRFVRWLSAYALLMGAGVAAVGAFLVLYAVEGLELSEPTAGAAAALMGAVGIVARVWWGRAAERMRTSTAPLVVLAVASVGFQALLWAAEAAGPWALWVGVVGFGATAGSWNAVGMLAIVREVDAAATGKASGVVQASFYVGMLACPIAFGAAVDATDAYGTGWAGVTGMFVLASVLALAWHRAERRRTAAVGR